MRFLTCIIIAFLVQSCTTKRYIQKQMLPKGIKSATEEIYLVKNNKKKLLQTKQMVFTKRGHIKTSITKDSIGNLIQETEKRLWLIKESYPKKEPYYCKTRWKLNQRERISCYTKKEFKENESIFHYNSNGTINKIVDNFTTFYTQYFYYSNNELIKIVVKDKRDKLIDEIQINCIKKDENGACVLQTRISINSNSKKELVFTPKY